MTKLREWAFKLRGGLWTALFLAILITAKDNGQRKTTALITGLALVILGQLWRFWAAGSIGRYRGEHVGAKQLVTWGPYALMRNPLYFGNGLIGLGWAVIAGPAAIILFVASFFILYCLLIIPHEESFLLERFGNTYREYQETTGAFWPGLRENPKFKTQNSLKGPFSFDILRKSEIHTVLTTVIGTVLIVGRVLLF